MNKRTKADSPSKTCTHDGCERALRARGLCSSHYNAAHQPNRHAKKMVECAWCGIEMLKQSGGGRKYGQTCSNQCRTYLTAPHCKLPADHWALWFGKTSQWQAPAPKPRFTSKQCADCPKYFTFENLPKFNSPIVYCSKQCSRRVRERNRRAKGYGAIGQYTRKGFYALVDAVGGLCSYCDRVVGGYADADHVTPVSRGGRNDLSNLTPACRECNGDKGDLTLDEWRESREQRLLEPRRYVLDPADARYKHLVPSKAVGAAWRHMQPA